VARQLPINETRTKSFALGRVNILVGRVFVISSVFTALETFLNAVSQNQVQTHPVSLAFLVALVAVQVANLVNFWLYSGSKIWYRIQVALVLLVTLFWPLIQGNNQDADGKPWVWWAVGMAGIAAHLGFRPWIAATVILLLPTAWFFLRTSDAGGHGDWTTALQDSIYTLLFSAALSSLVALLQAAAADVDRENQRATTLAAEQAQKDAIERERARVDALVHDKVLTTLLVAANAKTKDDEQAAAKLAVDAIAALKSDNLGSNSVTTVASLWLSLEQAITRAEPAVKVEFEGSSDQKIDPEVALALSEATLQAVANAKQHAGPAADCWVSLKANEKGLKLVIKDNGRGFRMARVPKNRLGLRLSIIDRVEAIGGRVFVDSEIGRGTNVIIEWSQR